MRAAGCLDAVTHQLQARECPGVVKARAEDGLHGDGAFDALDDAVDVLRQDVDAAHRGERHEVRERDGAGGRDKGGLQDVGLRQVALRRLVGAKGGDLEAAAALVVEDGGEDAGRIDAGHAAPVDGAVEAHEGGGVHVADGPVAADLLVCHGCSLRSECARGTEARRYPQLWACSGACVHKPRTPSTGRVASPIPTFPQRGKGVTAHGRARRSWCSRAGTWCRSPGQSPRCRRSRQGGWRRPCP